MNPRKYSITDNPKARQLLFGGLMILLLGVMLYFTFGRKLQSYVLSRVNLPTSQFAHLDKQNLYAYNGLAFYRLDLRDNKVKVLHTGSKLPKPSSIYWAGESGALLNFSESFSLTKVEQSVRSLDLRLSLATRAYTWYLDFSTGELTRAAIAPIKAGAAFFSEADKGFYYVLDYLQLDQLEHSQIPFGDQPLYFYDLATGRSRVVLDDLNVTDLSYLGACHNASYAICFIGRRLTDLKHEYLYAVSKSGSVTELLNSGGSLFATNLPAYYVSVAVDDEDTKGIDQTVDSNFQPARLHDLQKNRDQPLGLKFAGTELVAAFDKTGNFLVLDKTLSTGGAGDEVLALWSGELNNSGKGRAGIQPLRFASGESYRGNFVGRPSFGNNGEVLLGTIDQNYLLLTKEGENKSLLVKNGEEVKSVIEDCDNGLQDYEYLSGEGLYKLYFNDSRSFVSNIKSFSDCLVAADPNVLIGYSFYFGAIDSRSGRLTSD